MMLRAFSLLLILLAGCGGGNDPFLPFGPEEGGPGAPSSSSNPMGFYTGYIERNGRLIDIIGHISSDGDGRFFSSLSESILLTVPRQQSFEGTIRIFDDNGNAATGVTAGMLIPRDRLQLDYTASGAAGSQIGRLTAFNDVPTTERVLSLNELAGEWSGGEPFLRIEESGRFSGMSREYCLLSGQLPARPTNNVVAFPAVIDCGDGDQPGQGLLSLFTTVNQGVLDPLVPGGEQTALLISIRYGDAVSISGYARISN